MSPLATVCEVDRAWAAGLFDGEGSFSVRMHRSPRARPWPEASLVNSDLWLVEKFHDVVQVGVIQKPRRVNEHNRKTIWTWSVWGHEKVGHVYGLLAPWLSERRRTRAEEILALSAPQTLICPGCQEPFVQSRADQLYCSKRCGLRVQYRRNGNSRTRLRGTVQ